jgi:hypothetical protein
MDFFPGYFDGVLLLEERGDSRSEVLATAGFDVVVDHPQNIGSPMVPSLLSAAAKKWTL